MSSTSSFSLALAAEFSPFAKLTTEATSHFSRLSRKLWTSPFRCWGSCMAPTNAGMLGFPRGFQRSISSGWSTMTMHNSQCWDDKHTKKRSKTQNLYHMYIQIYIIHMYIYTNITVYIYISYCMYHICTAYVYTNHISKDPSLFRLLFLDPTVTSSGWHVKLHHIICRLPFPP